MPEITNKKDFVEVEFIGRQDGNVFDTNIKNEAKKLNPEAEPKPLVACIGEGLVVKGFDKALDGKEIGKKYTIKIPAEDAYGKRNSRLIRLIPKNVFIEHKMNPTAGMTILLDNALAKIISASGGRVLVDFNNPLAGKEVEYEFTIKRRVTNLNEKIAALQHAFFRQEFSYDIDAENKKLIFKDLQLISILDMFREKFKELLGYDLEILAKPEKSDEKKEAKTEKNEEKTENLEKSP